MYIKLRQRMQALAATASICRNKSSINFHLSIDSTGGFYTMGTSTNQTEHKMNTNTWKIKSNLSTHGYTFAVKAEYNRLKASGVSNVYCVNLAVQNVKRVIKPA